MTDTDVTFLLSSNIVGHTHIYVMTLTSPPFLPLSRPWAGLSVRWLVHPLLRIEDHQSSSPCLIFSVSSGCMQKFDPEDFLLFAHHRSDLVRTLSS
jgi:hypothetical protein